MTLDEELAEQYRTKRLKAVLDDYAELKKKFYGRAAYDFGEGSLNALGHELLEGKDALGAVQVFNLNAGTFPESGNVSERLAEACMKSGDVKNARLNYEKALTFDPANQDAKEMPKKLKESPQN